MLFRWLFEDIKFNRQKVVCYLLQWYNVYFGLAHTFEQTSVTCLFYHVKV